MIKMRKELRQIDELGRIVLPKTFLFNLNMNPLDKIEIIELSDGLLLQKSYPTCNICGSQNNLIKLKSEKFICHQCLDEAKEDR